jgi:hypothetical protein
LDLGAQGGNTGSGGGSSTGATGTGGGANGGAENLVTPTQAGSQYALSVGEVTLQVDPTVGARITTLSIGGNNLLTSSSVNPTNWGSTFWTSPQNGQNGWKPSGLWPPPAQIDTSAYTGGISGNHVVLDGAVYAPMGVSASKDFSADASTGWITITYTIHATAANTMAPWQVTRLFPGGLVFFPTGTAAMTACTAPGLTLSNAVGMTWFDSATLPTSAGKMCGDGTGGWIGYVKDGILFLQKFTDVPTSAQAPGEGEIELYAGQNLGYFELEVQGPYTQLAAGASLPWTVKWRVVRVPSSVTVGVGSQTLVDFAVQQAQ